jgi:hypothetical protein
MFDFGYQNIRADANYSVQAYYNGRTAYGNFALGEALDDNVEIGYQSANTYYVALGV